MRIKIIVSRITVAAGTERAVVNLANNLLIHGHEVAILSLYTSEGRPYFDLNENVKIEHLNIKQSQFVIIRIICGFIITLCSVYSNITQRDEVIIGTNHVHNFLLAIIKLLKPSKKFFGCEHLSFTALTKYSKFLAKCLYKYLDALIVLTVEDRMKFKNHIKGLRCETIPNELSFYPPVPSTCENKKLLAIGRYTHQKGFDLLIDIVSDVFKNIPDWILTIIGNGELYNHLHKQIDMHHMQDRILLVAPTRDVLDAYLQSSVYLMTSRYEGLPMVLLEAKACGLPIIAYDCPTGPSTLIQQNDGIIVEMNNKTNFEQNLIYLMEDPQRRKTLGSAARHNSFQYNRENTYKKWNDLLYSV